MKTYLRDLGIGQVFYAASSKKKTPTFRVAGPHEFSSRHGSPVRRCVDLTKKEFVNKSSRLEVVKVIPKQSKD